MKRLIAACLAFGLVASAAAEEAVTLRSTEMKAKPYSDAQTLLTLPERSKVQVLQRRASWTQVKSGETSGWVKMLSLQLVRGTTQRRADNGLRSLFNVAQTGRGGGTVTTGVRGLSEEDLKNAKPNPQELEEAKLYAASKAEAKRFAMAGKLKAQQVDYLPGGER
ncbi:MAG: SH3 domain-containing protein [Gammaproteobacteria bacterium]|nr:SH3 domain-containing protein [Sideroxydans sp.]MBU3902722.1 SH3 domain-containing protein [Gammaproteobacteria bacterium]MBU4046284.1 SH3 domain-containing protein [Gammaproteobacteria bacterium]MBU4150515.1 SH3 domain-containing protein [Gammaproteobacteria bacterium]